MKENVSGCFFSEHSVYTIELYSSNLVFITRFGIVLLLNIIHVHLWSVLDRQCMCNRVIFN